MPQVIIRHCAMTPSVALNAFKRRVTPEMRAIVAHHLSCPGVDDAELTLDNISVEWRQLPSESLTHDVQIMIMANDFPERRENLPERVVAIKAEVGRLLSHEMRRTAGATEIELNLGENTAHVWVLLCPAAFEEFAL